MRWEIDNWFPILTRTIRLFTSRKIYDKNKSMPSSPEVLGAQSGEERPPETLSNLDEWLTNKGIPKEHASRTIRLIEDFYSNHPLPTVGDSAIVGLGGETTEFGGLYLWVYNFWPTAREDVDIAEMERMNAFTIPFSEEVSRPLRPHLSVRPKFLSYSDRAVIDSFEGILVKGCKEGGIDYLGIYRTMNNKGRSSSSPSTADR